MDSQRAIVAISPVGSVGANGAVHAVGSPLGADLQDQVIQQLFAIGLAMQSTHRKETSPEQALRISDHIDQLHDVLEQLRKPAG